MKNCPSGAELNFLSTGTTENSTFTPKSPKTKEKQETKQKTKTAPKNN